MSDYKRRCAYYEEVQDMGAHIPTCNFYNRLGYCPCDSCHSYVDKYKELSNVVHGLISIHDDESAVCSICLKPISQLSVTIKDVKYCPFCGAKFDGFCHFSEVEDSNHE